MIQAIRPRFNRTRQEYEVTHLAPADPLLAYQGWVIYDEPARAAAAIQAGALLNHWTPRKRACVLAWLQEQAQPG